MTARPVTGAEQATFARDGVVCLRAALDPALLTAMAEPVEQALRSRETADLTEMGVGLAAAGETVLSDAAGTGRFASGVDHWRVHEAFAAFARTSELPRLVAELLGSTDLFLYEDSVLVKEPGAAERTAWHQDLGYFHVDGPMLATTWCPLDPVTPATGAVRYARGSHRWGDVYKPNLFVTTMAIPGTEGPDVPDVDALVAAGECEVVTFSTEPGDVVVHDARILHAAGPNTSATVRRRAISVRYCGDDTVVRLRPGAPRKAHQADWVDGTPFAEVAGTDHPRVAPVAGD